MVWNYLSLFQIILGQHQTGLDSLTLYKKLLFACTGSICSKLQWTHPSCVCSPRKGVSQVHVGPLAGKTSLRFLSNSSFRFNPFLRESKREAEWKEKNALFLKVKENYIHILSFLFPLKYLNLHTPFYTLVLKVSFRTSLDTSCLVSSWVCHFSTVVFMPVLVKKMKRAFCTPAVRCKVCDTPALFRSLSFNENYSWGLILSRFTALFLFPLPPSKKSLHSWYTEEIHIFNHNTFRSPWFAGSTWYVLST